ncbi:MAG: GntR family transcriptional regulator [Crocinitomicaceae bacterium]|nr:GntR family transcriptional regulator [Crocinitomicaceae bacterium]
MKIYPGKIQDLSVAEEADRIYMIGDEKNTISLPKRDVGKKLELGDRVRVFTFYNESRELEATTKLPSIEVGGFGSFRIKNSNDLGAFIDIGIKRDILIPRKEQREELIEGRMALVTLQADEKNRRLFASTRLSSFVKNTDIHYQRGQEVDLLIADKIEIGRRVIINRRHLGALFRQEMMRNLHEGETVKGYIRKIEGHDITVSMQKEGEELILDAADRLLEFLKNNNGYIRLTDDSDPEEIKIRLRMSKKTFKKAVGHLYKKQIVVLTKFGVKLANREQEIVKDDRKKKW